MSLRYNQIISIDLSKKLLKISSQHEYFSKYLKKNIILSDCQNECILFYGYVKESSMNEEQKYEKSLQSFRGRKKVFRQINGVKVVYFHNISLNIVRKISQFYFYLKVLLSHLKCPFFPSSMHAILGSFIYYVSQKNFFLDTPPPSVTKEKFSLFKLSQNLRPFP